MLPGAPSMRTTYGAVPDAAAPPPELSDAPRSHAWRRRASVAGSVVTMLAFAALATDRRSRQRAAGRSHLDAAWWHRSGRSTATDDAAAADDDGTGSKSSSSSAAAATASASAPHILIVLADDMGWNDISYNNVTNLTNQVLTPNLDALAAAGVTLTRFYAQCDCTPSRSALLTGLYPIRTGMYHETISQTSPWGLPVKFTLLPAHLANYGCGPTCICIIIAIHLRRRARRRRRGVAVVHVAARGGRVGLFFNAEEEWITRRRPRGYCHTTAASPSRLVSPFSAARRGGRYKTYAIGKWDIGHASWAHTPMFRGFDSYVGYYGASEDYFCHHCCGNVSPNITANCTNSSIYDFNRNGVGLAAYHECVFAAAVVCRGVSVWLRWS